MNAFELRDLLAERAEAGRPYFEFLRVPDLSAGLYVVPAGDVDEQQPHLEDELYYVISGRGRISVAEEDRAVEAGSFVFVAAQVPHQFHDVEEDLVIVVVFGPAEGTRR